VISLWLLLFAAQPKDFFLDGLNKLEQRNVWSSGGICRVNIFFNPVACFLYKAKDLSAPSYINISEESAASTFKVNGSLALKIKKHK
jgi:hypothetical protein